MRLQITSLAGVMALVLSTTVAAQDITKKPVTGADRKKATTETTTKTPATDTDAATDAARGATTTDSQPVSRATTQTTTPTTTSTQRDTTQPDEPAAPQSAAPGQTGATPGEAQTTPGEASELAPAQTGTTPSQQSAPSNAPAKADAAKVTAATKDDVKAGGSVYDSKGGTVGKVESVDAKGAVVNTGAVKATIPIGSFAKSDKGLVISMTKAEIDAAAKKSAPASTKPTKETNKPK